MTVSQAIFATDVIAFLFLERRLQNLYTSTVGPTCTRQDRLGLQNRGSSNVSRHEVNTTQSVTFVRRRTLSSGMDHMIPQTGSKMEAHLRPCAS
ncbi:hypothetical protein AVEN_205805-1 [Araneus ventricosus]|uniref:Uncharacterized protein n=1 Tax=Araneus ventricosus TaxID=182803 RepID=A0A4Y2JWE2_ARAVE|nr:hypothetical protein AVEN_205805-1 [Araneus ventricosus]